MKTISRKALILITALVIALAVAGIRALDDYLDQMQQLKNMGSMEELLAQMPGGANLKGVKFDEKAMARQEAIILSMTPKERENPGIIAASRKKRIAAGCGLKVEDVNKLLKSYRLKAVYICACIENSRIFAEKRPEIRFGIIVYMSVNHIGVFSIFTMVGKHRIMA